MRPIEPWPLARGSPRYPGANRRSCRDASDTKARDGARTCSRNESRWALNHSRLLCSVNWPRKRWQDRGNRRSRPVGSVAFRVMVFDSLWRGFAGHDRCFQISFGTVWSWIRSWRYTTIVIVDAANCPTTLPVSIPSSGSVPKPRARKNPETAAGMQHARDLRIVT